MRRDIRSWEELEEQAGDIEEEDDVVLHVGGYEVKTVVEDCSEVRESVGEYAP
jgi:hypothetical protein